MLDFEVVLKSAKYWKENWLKTFRLQNELAAEAHKMAVWYMAASLILVAVLIALASVASMVFVFCFRHHSGPVACDYCKSFHFSFNPWSKSWPFLQAAYGSYQCSGGSVSSWSAVVPSDGLQRTLIIQCALTTEMITAAMNAARVVAIKMLSA